MKGGHNRKPRSAKIIQGTFRQDRNPQHEPKPAAIEVIPRPPSHLNKYAKRLWKQLAPHLVDQGLLTELDVFTLELLCDSYGLYMDARDAIFRPVDPETGKRTRRTFAQYMEGRNSHTAPEAMILKTAFNEYKALAAEFGLGPASRNRIDIPAPPENEVDPMEELLNGD